MSEIIAKTNDYPITQLIFAKNKTTLTHVGDSALKIIIDHLRNNEGSNLNLCDGNNFKEIKKDKNIFFKRTQVILDSLKANNIDVTRVYINPNCMPSNNHYQGILFSILPGSSQFEVFDTISIHRLPIPINTVLNASEKGIGKFIYKNFVEFEWSHRITLVVNTSDPMKDKILAGHALRKRLAEYYKIPERSIFVGYSDRFCGKGEIILTAW
ncbi:MAG: hypothetical protein Q8R57_01400 [Bacteroidota bacterium]|nr:hypothetical protein [Bacteroidota bacterium]